MISNKSATPMPVWPGVSPRRRQVLVLCTVAFLLSGVLCGTGIAGTPKGIGLLCGFVLWVGALVGANLLTKTDYLVSYERPIGSGGLFWGAAACGWLGLGLSNGTKTLPLLVVLPLPVLFCVLLVRGQWNIRQSHIRTQRWAAERARKFEEESEVVRGVITDLASGYGDNVKLTVRYTAADGVEYTETVSKEIPVFDMPKRGDGVTIRHLRDNPEDFELEVDLQGVPRDDPAPATPADAPRADAPRAAADEGQLVGELERLAVLHERGHLTDEEFTKAKGLLLKGA